jgi:hypothetical protein
VHPEPGLQLKIGTDPTAWVLQDADENAVAGELSRATGPVVLPVAAPLQGRLVLNPRYAATVSLLRPPSVVGAHPTGATAPTRPVVYFPSVTPATQDSPGHALDPGTDLAALEQDIVTAMTGGTSLTLQVNALSGSGLLVLNGAVLAFVVLAQVTASGPPDVHGAHPTG